MDDYCPAGAATRFFGRGDTHTITAFHGGLFAAMNKPTVAGTSDDPTRRSQAATAHLLEARRDPKRFARFYEQEHRDLFRYLRAQVLCPEIAADLTAETFAKALVGLRRFDPKRGNGRQWLYGIARNELRAWVRDGQVSRRFRERVGLQIIQFTEIDEALIDHRIDVAGLLERSRLAFEALDASDRELVQLRVVDGLDYASIAARIGCTAATARVRAYRALARLRAEVLDSDTAPLASEARL